MSNLDISVLNVYVEIDKIFSFIIDGVRVKEKKIFQTGAKIIDREELERFLAYIKNKELPVSFSGDIESAFKKIRFKILGNARETDIIKEAKKYKGWIKVDPDKLSLMDDGYAKDFISSTLSNARKGLFVKINGGKGMPWKRLNAEWEIYNVDKNGSIVVSIGKYRSRAFFKVGDSIKKIENRSLGWYNIEDSLLQDKIVSFAQFVINQAQFEIGRTDIKIFVYQTVNKDKSRRENRIFKTHLNYLLRNELPTQSINYSFEFCNEEKILHWTVEQMTKKL